MAKRKTATDGTRAHVVGVRFSAEEMERINAEIMRVAEESATEKMNTAKMVRSLVLRGLRQTETGK